MKTVVTRVPSSAAATLIRGGLVAFPTETVYGLGANALSARSVQKIFRAKGRPADNPLIVHVGEFADIERVVRRIPPSAEKLMAAFFPGPLTLIMPKHNDIPTEVSAGLDTVGVRMPLHPIAIKFLRECGVPVAAPSANRSGRPSPTTWQAVHDEMDGRIDCILKGGPSKVGLESTVVDCSGSRPILLRQGAISLEALREVVDRISTAKQHVDGKVKSPGMKYRHYAPTAKVILVDGPHDVPIAYKKRTAYIGLTARGFKKKPFLVTTCREVPAYAQKLFHFFRVCEKRDVDVIYCQRVPRLELGRALMDRLQRAADDHPIAP
ncbi:MAG TPA: L-threonylcarbamoyladenylate synthase [Kiritimatiellia bacterium]|nr:L-threonylcarbamoyladenylate synthase [Kiritimatiellia bacterium]